MDWLKKARIAMFFSFIIICLLVELVGGAFTRTSVDTWYPTLHKSPLTPPAALFGPVWTILYLLMASALWLVWRTETTVSKLPAYITFVLQLTLNLLWSALFFGLQSPFLALIDISILLIIIALTMYSFWRVRPLASLMLLPYILWVSFALYLNFTIWKLN